MMSLFVKFANADVPIYKLRKGTLVECGSDFLHIEHVYRTQDGHVRLHLVGMYEEGLEILPLFVDWLEG